MRLVQGLRETHNVEMGKMSDWLDRNWLTVVLMVSGSYVLTADGLTWIRLAGLALLILSLLVLNEMSNNKDKQDKE